MFGENFVMFPVRMFSYRDQSSYIPKEGVDALLVYYVLGKLSTFQTRKLIYCNLDLIVGMVTLDIRKTRARQKIASALELLESLGYITIKRHGETLQGSLVLEVELVEDFGESVSDGTKYSGFEKVNEELFQLAANDSKLFRVLIYVQYRQRIGYTISFAEWANVLGVSETTAKTMIKQYEEQGKLIVQHGQHYQDSQGKIKQERNGYSLPVKGQKKKPVNVQLIQEKSQQEPAHVEQTRTVSQEKEQPLPPLLQRAEVETVTEVEEGSNVFVMDDGRVF